MLPKIERTSPVIPIKEVNHSDLLLIHKPHMSFLMFHSGNIPIIEEDDMKLVELIIVSNSVVTSSIASDLMYGHIDGVKLKCLNQAHNNNFLIIIPDVFVNMEVEGVNLYLPNNVLFLNDEGTQKLVKIICYQDGDQEFQMAATM